jgi:hypothetical protein
MKRSTSAPSGPSFWAPAIFLPVQLTARRQRACPPEVRLVAAVFEDALQCVLRDAPNKRGAHRREFSDACRWFWDNSREWPFAFVNVCDMLGLDRDAVRQRLQHIGAMPPVQDSKRNGPTGRATLKFERRQCEVPCSNREAR